MSDVRSDVARVVEIVHHESGGDCLAVADAVIATIREALLSPEAVEAAITGIWGRPDYADSHGGMHEEARAGIAAALEAAGLRGGDGDE